ncbi:MAG: hypothetical protein ABI697_03260 [Devosia sp.]
MRIVVHGGMHKTGTTSLQVAMVESHVALKAAGFYYPVLPRGQHIALLNTKRPGWEPGPLLAARELAGGAGAHTLLLSAEDVSTMSAAQMQRLRATLSGDAFTFVFCFRHWHAFWPSRWAQNITRRDSQGFEAYLEMISRPQLMHPDLNFTVVLERALTVDDASVTAISFDRAIMAPGGLLEAVLSVAGVRSDTIDLVRRNERRENTRVPWQEVEALRLLNGVLAQSVGLPQDDLCRATGEHRRPDRFFDLVAAWGWLAPATMVELIAAIDGHAREIRLAGDARFAAAAARLDEHRALFANADDTRVFDTTPDCVVTTTSLDWQDFATTHRQLATEALRQMLSPTKA